MSFFNDVRFAVRMIRKNPWFSAAIVLTLAFGIGMNTTVFTLVNAVLQKPLPFPGGERLAMAFANTTARPDNFRPISYPDFRDYRAAAKSFDYLEAYAGQPLNISEKGNPPNRYRGALVSSGIFDMLHVKPHLGRGFTPADDAAGAERVILIGYGVWKERYGSDPKVIGRTVRLNEKPAVIIGVMPEGFKFPNSEDIWQAAAPLPEWEKRNSRMFNMIALRKEGVSTLEAQAELAVVAKRLEQQFPDSHKDYGIRVVTFHQAMNGGPIRIIFLLMLGAVGFVLLIACANVANLLLARAIARTREISIRAALGAGKWRIIRQLLIESIVLSTVGGLLGLLLAQVGIRAFDAAVQNVGKPYWIQFTMDYTVFVYFACVTILSGLIFGLAPAFQAARVDLNTALKEGTRGAGGGHSGFVSKALVVTQFVLAVVLLTGAGLLMREFLLAQEEFANMPTNRILNSRVNLPEQKYSKPEDRQRFFDTMLPRLASLPGVEIAAITSAVPGSGSEAWHVEAEGQPAVEFAKRPVVAGVIAGPGYFKLIAQPPVAGREFEDSDGLPGKLSAVVNQQLASIFWPQQSPIGKRIRTVESSGKTNDWLTIVGMIPNFRQADPRSNNNRSILFVPYRKEAYRSMNIMLRTQGNPNSIAPAMRAEIQSVDEDLPLFGVNSLEEDHYRGRWYLRVFGTIFMVFGIVAVTLAAVGIYAVMAQATNRRTHELGIRLALGADKGNIIGLVLRSGIKQLAIGMILGIGAASGLCQFLSTILLRTTPRDPITFTFVAFVLALAGLIACWLPARRAAMLDPVRALRNE